MGSTSRSTGRLSASRAKACRSAFRHWLTRVGAAAFALMPLYWRIETHALSAQRLHGDDTTVPVMAKGKTDIARLWAYVHDDRPLAGTDPPTALFHYSRDRHGEHPCAHLATWSGMLQADACGGYNELYAHGRQPGPVLEAGCFAHARRKFSSWPMSKAQPGREVVVSARA
jgi:hypothetical protein